MTSWKDEDVTIELTRNRMIASGLRNYLERVSKGSEIIRFTENKGKLSTVFKVTAHPESIELMKKHIEEGGY